MPRHRGGVDDLAVARFQHDPALGLGAEEHAGQVQGDDLVPLLLGHRFGGFPEADAGIVDADGELAPAFHDGVDHGLHLIGLGHVGDDGHGVDALGLQLCGDRLGVVVVDVHNRDGGAGFAQRVGVGAADALAAARDQRYPAVQPETLENRFGFENFVRHVAPHSMTIQTLPHCPSSTTRYASAACSSEKRWVTMISGFSFHSTSFSTRSSMWPRLVTQEP